MKRMMIGLLALAGTALSAPLWAGDDKPKEEKCTWVRKTEDGRFRNELHWEWSLLEAGRDPAGTTLPDDVTGLVCLRDPPVLVPGDLVFLKQGRSLYFGVQDQGITMVKYELVDGKVTWTVRAGGLGDKNRKKVEKSVAAVQALVGG